MSLHRLHPYLAFCQAMLISFPNSHCFISKKYRQLTVSKLIFEIFGPILSFPLSVCGSYPVELTSLHPISYLMTLFDPISN